MARDIVVRLRDDIDGSDAAETVRFAYRGREYEIELSKGHVAELEAALTPFLEHGRRVRDTDGTKKRVARQSRAAPSHRAAELARIREWARANGYQVSDRGRIPQAVMARYEEAHPQAS